MGSSPVMGPHNTQRKPWSAMSYRAGVLTNKKK